ncbi:MAG TPA: prepilin peptidase [Acetobacteraceae bacterium]|jgi:prepilin peptidase CpaA|nr:prepilin peptidase [Acetobacteraceae bacterium]
MISIRVACIELEVMLLLYTGCTEIAARMIPNAVCLMLATLGITHQMLLANPRQFGMSLIAATCVFLALLFVFTRGWIDGGDVKLLTAVSIGLPADAVMHFLTITVLAGGVLALVYPLLRLLPYPALSAVGSSLVRRVYAIERWRTSRHAPLPYGVAIACGGIWTLAGHGV